MSAGHARCTLFDDRFSLESPTGALLNVHRASAKGRARGVMLVSHGLAEHSARYAAFAGEMSRAGLAVYAHDHRGHGSTEAYDAPLRRFAKKNGPMKVVADVEAVRERAAEENPGLPVVLFGQSMGGLVALNYAIRHGHALAGLAAWNAGFRFGLQERLAVVALKLEKALKGSDAASALFAAATFHGWGKSISPRRTLSDWLSHDPAAVDAYLSDPLCGWIPTISMAADLVTLAREATDEGRVSQLPSALPIHLLAGTEDPSTQNGEMVKNCAGGLRLAGSRDVTLTLVAGARHETLHEIAVHRAAAIASLVAWIDRILPVH